MKSPDLHTHKRTQPFIVKDWYEYSLLNTYIKLHSLFATIRSLSCSQFLMNHTQHLVETSVVGVVHEHLVGE